MKAKFLFILLSVLFIVPMETTILAKSKNRARLERYNRTEHGSARIPLDFDLDVQDTNGCLQIIFQSSLPDAEITVIDKDGNAIINQLQTSIYEGKMLIIHTPNAYPYTIEIISPTMDITGEIVQE